MEESKNNLKSTLAIQESLLIKELFGNEEKLLEILRKKKTDNQ